MKQRVDISGNVGKVFGLLLYKEETDYNNKRMGIFSCSCGVEKVLPLHSVFNGNTKSCGCYKKEVDNNRFKTHGFREGTYEMRIFYSKWCDMKARCNRPKKQNYKWYGGRGISYCDRWKDFMNFKEDMWITYLDHVEHFGIKETTIDRINTQDHYSKENCKWSTWKEQKNNMSNNVYLVYQNTRYTLQQLANKFALSTDKIRDRIKKGKAIEDIINELQSNIS